ncbi:MAG: 16S rRNA (cytidine(1402)-2'-O)-methyltransferase [Nannocystaceae bacterium]|nr:16S rRNA (cytidine(1402)-2'-O)-methyltransferase [Nannocystaceae bacterium]
MAGKLVLVGTPLGNRDDLSPRARAAIVGADVLLCEDTRSPLRLLGEGVTLPPRRSCFVGNEHEREAELVAMLAEGKTVAFVSEAGMPCWSDPGQRLVAAAVAAGHAVEVVPGPTAMATAVAWSGLPADEVRYCGFPPRSGKAREQWLASLRHETATVVCYEAANRTWALLQDLARALPDADTRTVVVARELTKRHEQALRGSVAALAAAAHGELLGEVTVVLGPGTRAHEDPAQHAARATVAILLDASLRPRQKARQLAELTGLPARELYARLAVEPGDDDDQTR